MRSVYLPSRFALLTAVLLVAGGTGCDAFEDLFEKEKETRGLIEAIGESSLTVEGIEYSVTNQTEYEGINGLSDLAVGDEVEIEYKEDGGTREAVEIELIRAGEGGLLDLALCSPSEQAFTLDIDHPFFPMPVGRKLVLEGEEDGETIHVEITVLDETEEVAGVTTRVVEEREEENGELIEISRNFFAQTEEGTLCYFGEDVDNYENGEIVNNDGSWRAGEDSNRPGIYLPANPEVGQRFAREDAPGEAEDMAAVTALGETVVVPFGTFEETLSIIEWNPLEGGSINDGDEKVYASGIGLVFDEVIELISVE